MSGLPSGSVGSAGSAGLSGSASLAEVLGVFRIPGEMESVVPFGKGHINDTFHSRWRSDGGPRGYIHQRINDRVFRRPDEVMDNILRVTGHIASRLLAAGIDDVERRTLTVVPAASGNPWFRDARGGWWRTYLFIDRAHSEDMAESPVQAGLLGAEIGKFQRMLSDLPPPRLHETIPAFHDMRSRYALLDAAAARDPLGRLSEVGDELEFMARNRKRGTVLVDALESGGLPSRICHNDAKLNNILLDDASSKALCVVDLDTVMPGTALFDFGDLVRTVAATAPEDQAELAAVGFDRAMYRALLSGYLSEAAFLVPTETGLLAEAGRNLAQIMALRFLTDYLEGDLYYKIARPSHNLDRCRNQIALVRAMDDAAGDIERITSEELAIPLRRE